MYEVTCRMFNSSVHFKLRPAMSAGKIVPLVHRILRYNHTSAIQIVSADDCFSKSKTIVHQRSAHCTIDVQGINTTSNSD